MCQLSHEGVGTCQFLPSHAVLASRDMQGGKGTSISNLLFFPPTRPSVLCNEEPPQSFLMCPKTQKRSTR